MSCVDLREYVLGELTERDRRPVELHLEGCAGCREELERLRVTMAALRALPEEEIPQRIAFVSDRVFEPSPWRRALAAFWGSSARLGFAAAAMLSVALVVAAVYRRPAPVIPPAAGVSQAEVARQVNTAVEKAVAESESRQAAKTAALVAEVEKRDALERQSMTVAFSQSLEILRKQANVNLIAANDYLGQRGEGR